MMIIEINRKYISLITSLIKSLITNISRLKKLDSKKCGLEIEEITGTWKIK